MTRYFGLGQFIKYNSQITSARWSETSNTWTVQLQDGSIVESEILVNAGGILNNPQLPAIEGFSTFAGPRLHTAAWDSSINLKGTRVAIIGSGASAVQLLPQLQPLSSMIQVYIRTPSWISPPVALPTETTSNYAYAEAEQEKFRWNEDTYLKTRKELENQFNGMFRAFFKARPEQTNLRLRFEARMKSLIPDENLRRHLIPSFETGCRRINPGEQFLVALQKANVEPVFDTIDRITPKGVVAGGVEYPADILVAATGFNTTFRPRFPIIGRNAINLQDLWAENPVSYLGTGVARFPNYFIFLGPNTPISNGSLMGNTTMELDRRVR